MLTPRVSHRWFTLFAGLSAGAIVALLAFGHYTRTARLSGWLVPQGGVVSVYAPRPGTIGPLKVSDGTRVRRGDPLLTISDELTSATSGATQAQIMRRLAERDGSMRDEHAQQRLLLEQQQSTLSQRLSTLDAEVAQLTKEIQLQQARTRIAERSRALYRRQYADGFISENRMQLVEAELLDQRAKVAALERSLLAVRREREAAAGELRDLPLKFTKEIGGLERGLAQLGQERAEVEARREIVVPAPSDGTVTAIQAVPGTHADTNVPLLALLPLNETLEAHLYAPSRAVGFLQPGQRVHLHHQAFPYQKFGYQEGVVHMVSRSAVSPAELPRGMAGAAGAPPAEPVYRVTVRLTGRSPAAAGTPMPLRAGMLVDADVALEKRRLIEWVLEPLYTVTGRWQ